MTVHDFSALNRIVVSEGVSIKLINLQFELLNFLLGNFYLFIQLFLIVDRVLLLGLKLIFKHI